MEIGRGRWQGCVDMEALDHLHHTNPHKSTRIHTLMGRLGSYRNLNSEGLLHASTTAVARCAAPAPPSPWWLHTTAESAPAWEGVGGGGMFRVPIPLRDASHGSAKHDAPPPPPPSHTSHTVHTCIHGCLPDGLQLRLRVSGSSLVWSHHSHLPHCSHLHPWLPA